LVASDNQPTDQPTNQNPPGSLEAYESALKAHRARQAAAAAAKDGAAANGSAGGAAGEAAAANTDGEGVYRVPAKLLNNVAVLRYRWAGRLYLWPRRDASYTRIWDFKQHTRSPSLSRTP
jgi:hypothetical protein